MATVAQLTRHLEKVIEASLCLSLGISDEFIAADPAYGPGIASMAYRRRRMSLHGAIAEAMRAEREPCPHGGNAIFAALMESKTIEAAGFSTVSLPGILGNVANKLLLQAFTSVESTYDVIANQAEFSNFQKQSIYRLDALGDFPIVPPDGEIKHGSLGQDAYQNQLATRGMMLTLSRQSIINDDLSAFRSLAAMLGRKARVAVEQALYQMVMEASDSFYSVANGNRLVGALGITELGAAEAALTMMADQAGTPIFATPKYLLVPPALKYLADQLFTSQYVDNYTTNVAMPTANPFQQRFPVVSSPFLSQSTLPGSSASTWYLIADPLLLPAFQVAYLTGKRLPTVETSDTQFNTLGLHMRCYWDFGVTRLDYRGAIKNTAT
jgi:hypothetical protein